MEAKRFYMTCLLSIFQSLLLPPFSWFNHICSETVDFHHHQVLLYYKKRSQSIRISSVKQFDSDLQLISWTLTKCMLFFSHKAINSLNKYPLPLKNAKEAKILQNFGDGICKILDEKMQRYLRENGEEQQKDGLCLFRTYWFVALTFLFMT